MQWKYKKFKCVSNIDVHGISGKNESQKNCIGLKQMNVVRVVRIEKRDHHTI